MPLLIGEIADAGHLDVIAFDDLANLMAGDCHSKEKGGEVSRAAQVGKSDF